MSSIYFNYSSVSNKYDFVYVKGIKNSPDCSENSKGLSKDKNAQLYVPNSNIGVSSLHEEFPGFASPNDVKQSGR